MINKPIMFTRPLSGKVWLSAMLAVMLFSACENDINKIKAIAAADATKPIQRTTDLDVIFSDSAQVKFRLTSPLYIEYKVEKPYGILPNGVKIIFLDKDAKEAGNIVADSASMHDDNKFIEFHKNVVAKNSEGTVYKSDELIWDQKKKTYSSNKPVEMTKIGGDVMRGTSFVSDDKLQHPIFQNSTAIIHVNGDGLTQ